MTGPPVFTCRTKVRHQGSSGRMNQLSCPVVLGVSSQSKQAGSRVGQPVVSGDLRLPILPLTQTGSFQPRSFPQSHHHLVIFVPCSLFLCVRGRAGVRGSSHILNPPFLQVCSSEFGRNSCPRYQLLLPEVCEYL